MSIPPVGQITEFNPETPFYPFPDELLLWITHWLVSNSSFTASDFSNLALTCRKWNVITQDDFISHRLKVTLVEKKLLPSLITESPIKGWDLMRMLAVTPSCEMYVDTSTSMSRPRCLVPHLSDCVINNTCTILKRYQPFVQQITIHSLTNISFQSLTIHSGDDTASSLTQLQKSCAGSTSIVMFVNRLDQYIKNTGQITVLIIISDFAFSEAHFERICTSLTKVKEYAITNKNLFVLFSFVSIPNSSYINCKLQLQNFIDFNNLSFCKMEGSIPSIHLNLSRRSSKKPPKKRPKIEQ